MTHTTHDYRSLLTACRHNLADDVERLKLADAIDEMDAPMMKCGKCKGTRHVVEHRLVGNLVMSVADGIEFDAPHTGRWIVKCDNCAGTGFVRDLTRVRHAELIRVSVELSCRERTPLDSPCRCTRDLSIEAYQAGIYCGPCQRRLKPIDELRARESELTTALADYRPTCPVCRGVESRAAYYEDGQDCPCCKGEKRIGTFTRGLLVLTVPTMDVLYEKVCSVCLKARKERNRIDRNGYCARCDSNADWSHKLVPTAWAIDAVHDYPTVQIVVEDRVPWIGPYHGGVHWFDESLVGKNAFGHTVLERESLPTPIWKHLPGEGRMSELTWQVNGVELARSSLATAFVLAIAEHQTEEK